MVATSDRSALVPVGKAFLMLARTEDGVLQGFFSVCWWFKGLREAGNGCIGWFERVILSMLKRESREGEEDWKLFIRFSTFVREPSGFSFISSPFSLFSPLFFIEYVLPAGLKMRDFLYIGGV